MQKKKIISLNHPPQLQPQTSRQLSQSALHKKTEPPARIHYSPETITQTLEQAEKLDADNNLKEAEEKYAFLCKHTQGLVGQELADKLTEEQIAAKYPEIFPCYIKAIERIGDFCLSRIDDDARYIKTSGLYNHALVVNQKFK